MQTHPLLIRTLIFLWMIGAVAKVHAITIEIDLSTDTSGFLGSGNPAGPVAGAQAQAAFRAASAFFESILTDDLAAITPSNGNTWVRRYSHPATGQFVSETNRVVPANTFVLFVGARDLGGGTLARTTEVQTQAQGPALWQQTVLYRGQTTAPLNDLGPWGGSIAFDINSAWHFDHTALPPPNRVDFYSIALHEIAHALGFGSATSWRTRSGVENFRPVFRGPRVLAVYGQGAPLSADHWADDVMSRVFPSGTAQEASMTPTLGLGARRFFTDLDVAALEDMGWKVRSDLPDSPQTRWREQFFTAADLASAEKESSVWGDAADPDGDKSVNLVEYALGTVPTDAASRPRIEILRTASGVALHFRRRKNDTAITAIPERSSNLQTWESGADAFVPLTVTEAGADHEDIELGFSAAPLLDHAFVRVHVTKNGAP